MNPRVDIRQTEPGGPSTPDSPDPIDQGPPAKTPTAIGRYRVERLLGEGGFGRVFLAHDDQLERPVAVKVPRADRARLPGYAEGYLAEARVLARLDHPHIVPVHDVGLTEDGLPFLVSRFIEGSDLAQRIQQARMPFVETAELAAAVAEALHHAHRQGLVHRDVKPANILLDGGGKPYVADFGLALREEDFGKEGAGLAGTPAYMSPEQARGEGHRVDGRSDVFSLGVILYELLTRRRPFRGGPHGNVLEQITTLEPCPPRQIDDAIPKELERICLKALAKRASERYLTARDMADDLRHFLAHQQAGIAPVTLATCEGHLPPVPGGTVTVAPPAPATLAPSDGTAVRVVPKGLRSFDAHDADFFLALLPGPRDRDGLPDSVRFWKARVEEADPDGTFAVGLIYGPSGCGKSSLVKAGLLPRLSAAVLPVYVEATEDQTEARLLNGLRKRCPALPGGLGLREALAALRRGQGLPAGRKVLLVLDQFEQWLHARGQQENTELVAALRQCDGEHVQCLVLVRDDFWLAVSRFLQELEVRLVEGRNSALADLFDPAHARKVLAAFGRAFGRLPEGVLGREQDEFLDRAVAGLLQDGKVVCVRLALFAEMMKGRPWTPAALKAVGGAAGVGATFLEETFSAANAPPGHRYHQKAARAMLQALLPESGGDIKGHMRSHADLLAASGYASRPRDFDELIGILDGELRLLTPTDPEGKEADGDPAAPAPAGQRYYQLTHDFLVPALRGWLTRKQKETSRGRAELRLAERAALWNARPQASLLPAWWEWLSIRLLTRKSGWTAPQRKMMRRAARYHAARGLLLAAGLLLLGWAGLEGFGRLEALRLRHRLLEATTEEVPTVVAGMAPYRRWLDGSLREVYAEAEAAGNARKQLRASLALLPVDPGQVEYLFGRLLAGGPEEVLVLRESLRPHSDELGGRLWAVLEDRKEDPGRRLRAACALAAYVPDDDRWEAVSGDVAARLLAENPFDIRHWAEALRPVGKYLLPPLAALVLADGRGPEQRRTLARLYGGIAEGRLDGFGPLEKVLDEAGKPDGPPEAKLALARRQANAAAALAAVGRWEKVLPLLRHEADPTRRSYLIERLGPGGVEAEVLAERVGEATEAPVRRALLLALGDYDRDRLTPAQRDRLAPRLAGLYRDDADPGVRGAAGWLLRQWGRQEQAEAIDRALATGKPEGGRGWYVNGQGQTMVLVATPGTFWMGDEEEDRHRRHIGRRYALAAHEVTVAEFRRFREAPKGSKAVSPSADCPVTEVTWYDAAAYCNWLSRKEGIAEDQWCYLPNEKGEYGPGMRLAPDYLRRTGYRLPSEAEWEYACRGGSQTRWSHGEAEELLPRYAWYVSNAHTQTRPVGTARPNDLGLFDLHGNAREWCQDRYRDVGLPSGNMVTQDSEDIARRIDPQRHRMLRGGSVGSDAAGVRSANRSRSSPDQGGQSGFRPARTMP